MRKLKLDLFTKVDEDMEMRQYLILSALKSAKDEFTKNRLYPQLRELIQLRNSLQQIDDELAATGKYRRQEIEKIDLHERRIDYRYIEPEDLNIDQLRSTIQWALPHIDSTIEEGVALFEFVKDQLKIEEVGLVPNYRNEGYMLIPNHSAGQLALFRYELSIFKSFSDQYRTIKTMFLKSMDQEIIPPSLNDIKLDLIKEFNELPNPATYHFKTDLELPFESTLFPIVKRHFLEFILKDLS